MKKTLLFVGSVIILILSAITFIFIPAMTQGVETSLVFGKYGNKKIEYKQGTEFANAVANYTEMYRNQSGQLDDSAYFYIYNYAFNSAVQAVAYADAVEKSGYTPSEEAVNRAMLPYFSDENGTFSPAAFKSVPEAERENLKNELRKGLVWSRYSEDLMGSQAKVKDFTMFGLKSSDAEINFLAEMGADKRSFDAAYFDKKDYPDSAVVTYADENADKFNKYNLSVITVADSSKAKSILNQLKKEEVTFQDAVNEYSDKKYSGSDGVITSSYEYQIKEIIKNEKDEEKVLALAKDELSDVVETEIGYSIFRCDGEKVACNTKDKTTLSAIRNYISENEATKIEDFFITSAKGMTANAKTKTFATAAKDSEGKYISMAAFPLNYNNSSMFDGVAKDADELSGASNNETFLTEAFALKSGEYSEPIVLGDKIIVLKNTGSQKDKITDEKKAAYSASIASFDQSASQSALLTSSKVKNDVADVYFNKIMKNR